MIWHTQGSGKSLTMVFLAQVIRRNEELKKYKLLYITDRTQLDSQLTSTFQNTQDETVLQADSVQDLRELISKDSSDLITSTIQKFHIGKGSIAVPGNIAGLIKIHNDQAMPKSPPIPEELKKCMKYLVLSLKI